MNEANSHSYLPFRFDSILEMISRCSCSPSIGCDNFDDEKNSKIKEFFVKGIEDFRKATLAADIVALELYNEEENDKMLEEMQKQKKERKTERKKRRRHRKKLKKLESSENCEDDEELDKDTRGSEKEESFDVNSAFVSNAAVKISSNSHILKDKSSPVEANTVANDYSFPTPEEHPVTVLAFEGFNCAKEGYLIEAIEKFSEAIFLTPEDYRLFANRCLCYLQIREFNKALEDAVSCTKYAPDYAMGYFRMGEAYLGLNDFQTAELAFERVLKIDPNCEEALNDLVFIRMKKLMDMGFSRKKATAALLKMKTLDAALEHLLHSSHDLDNQEEQVNDPSQFDDMGGSEIFLSDNDDSGENDDHEKGDVFSEASSAMPSCDIGVENDINEEEKDPYIDCNNRYHCKRLYIGNVSSKISKKYLESAFSRFGNIISIKIVVSSKCAFITYDDWKSAGEAMEKLQNWCLMQGTPPISIKYPYTDLQKLMGNPDIIISDKQKFKADGLISASGRRDNWCSQTMPPPSPAPSLSSVRSTYSQAVLHSPQRKKKIDSTKDYDSNKCASLFIGNLTHKVRESDLLSMFSKYGEVISIRVLPEKKCAFVNYTNSKSAASAMYNLQGRSVFAGLPPLVIKYPTKAIKTADPGSNNSKRDGQVIGDECYNWRTLGCVLGKRCPNKHIPEHRGIALRHKTFC